MSEPGARRFLVVGAGPRARRLHECFHQQAPRGWEWLGTVADDAVDPDLGANLGAPRDLAQIVASQNPTDLVVAIDNPALDVCTSVLDAAARGLRVSDALSLEEALTHRTPILGHDEAWTLALARLARRSPPAAAAKRTIDLVAGCLAFAAFAVALIPLAPLLALERAGSIFVHERRVGRFGRPFTMLRFRTARKASGEPHWPFADPAAPTRIGAVIGRLGIDRLPQSLAILSGHLSLVGPRPMDVEAQQRIAQALPVFLARSAIKPGLTGWEQMHHESRSNLDLLRQLEYDLYYVKYQSAALDIRILWRRALAVAGLRRGGN